MGLGLPSDRYKGTRKGLEWKRSGKGVLNGGPQLANQTMTTSLKTTTTVILRQFSVAMREAKTKENVTKTRDLSHWKPR